MKSGFSLDGEHSEFTLLDSNFLPPFPLWGRDANFGSENLQNFANPPAPREESPSSAAEAKETAQEDPFLQFLRREGKKSSAYEPPDSVFHGYPQHPPRSKQLQGGTAFSTLQIERRLKAASPPRQEPEILAATVYTGPPPLEARVLRFQEDTSSSQQANGAFQISMDCSTTSTKPSLCPKPW